MNSGKLSPEPHFSHGQAPLTGVLLCNLGTPDSPTAPALRRFLAEFLSDPRVVEIARLIWLPILYAIVLRLRPAKSAKKYASIWTPQGSPLRVWTESQASGLQQRFTAAGAAVLVRHAMTYGTPSVGTALDELRRQGVRRVLVLPTYPQYSSSSTAAVFDRIHRWSLGTRTVPEWRFVNHYHDDPGYLDALALSVRQHWQHKGPSEMLVMSFHGLPERSLWQGDPYHCECHKTARMLAERLGLETSQYRVCFQSRFGKAKWLQPYTESTLRALAESGCARVDVICPGFSCDCLETLEEINIELRSVFLTQGGAEFHYIHCLNDSPFWLDALYGLACSQMQGWSLAPVAADDLTSSRSRALAMGAKDMTR